MNTPRIRTRLSNGLIYASLVAGSVAALLPLVAIAMASFKTADEYVSTPFEPATLEGIIRSLVHS